MISLKPRAILFIYCTYLAYNLVASIFTIFVSILYVIKIEAIIRLTLFFSIQKSIIRVLILTEIRVKTILTSLWNCFTIFQKIVY